MHCPRLLLKREVIVLSVGFILLCLDNLNIELKQAVRKSSLPQKYSSILATVTTESFVGQHLKYLDKILDNFAEVCEHGYVVRVVLISYEDLRPKLLEGVSSRLRTCKRHPAALSHIVKFYSRRKLPKNAFGTAGDLAIRHREYFLQQLVNFDYFLVQEDDVSYSCKNIEYFVDTLKITEALSYSMHPTFFDYEIFGGEKFASYRMRSGYIFTMNDMLFFASGHDAAGRGYMLTSMDLRHFANETSWIDPNDVQGEFNPTVASGMTLQKSKRLVIPVRTWKNSGIHHMPNKYINMEKEADDTQFASLHFDVLDFIFASCSDGDLPTPRRISVTGSCLACIEHGGVTYMKTEFTGPLQYADSMIIVSYACRKRTEITFPGGRN